MAQRKFKHKQTGKIAVEIESAYKKEEFRQYEVGKLEALLPPFLVENTNDWEEILKYPVGTKIKDLKAPNREEFLQKDFDGQWYKWSKTLEKSWILSIETIESQIGEGKRFQVVKETCGINVSKPEAYGTIHKVFDEPKWRITAFRHKDTTNQIFVKSLEEETLFVCDYGLSLDYLLASNRHEIYSVEVLQDGKWSEFKIGDNISGTFSLDEAIRGYVTVDGFKFRDSLLYLSMDTGFVNLTDLSVSTIGGLKHYHKQPLFQLKDENGKMIDIYKGDWIHWVNSESLKTQSCQAYSTVTNSKSFIWFATEKAAQQYIDLNKKIFSKQDINDMIQSLQSWNIVGCDESVVKRRDLFKCLIQE